ncbi:MAG: hypothetical protein ACI8P3_003007 [Saprospiraceae bacterium]|jgi:hypothetical protein
MKNLLFILLIAPSIAMVTPDNLSNISKAISNGDAEALSQYFDDKVEVSLLDNENLYDKAQAKKALQSFFAKNKPQSYTQVHDGTSKGAGSKYTIGNLKSNGKVFRVYVYMKVVGEKYTIQEISISEE